jgi:opacity protein-like surface antigen
VEFLAAARTAGLQRRLSDRGWRSRPGRGVNCGASEEILRGLEIHAVFAFASFDSISGKDGNAYSYIAGTQYMVVRNVSLLAEVEYNTNPDFETDVRGNFGITYTFSWGSVTRCDAVRPFRGS